jgi:hypothetical protein
MRLFLLVLLMFSTAFLNAQVPHSAPFLKDKSEAVRRADSLKLADKVKKLEGDVEKLIKGDIENDAFIKSLKDFNKTTKSVDDRITALEKVNKSLEQNKSGLSEDEMTAFKEKIADENRMLTQQMDFLSEKMKSFEDRLIANGKKQVLLEAALEDFNRKNDIYYANAGTDDPDPKIPPASAIKEKPQEPPPSNYKWVLNPEVGILMNKDKNRIGLPFWSYFNGRVSLGRLKEDDPALWWGLGTGVDNYDAFYIVPITASVRFPLAENGFSDMLDASGPVTSLMAELGYALVMHEKENEYIRNFDGAGVSLAIGINLGLSNLISTTIYYKIQNVTELQENATFKSEAYHSINLNLGWILNL